MHQSERKTNPRNPSMDHIQLLITDAGKDGHEIHFPRQRHNDGRKGCSHQTGPDSNRRGPVSSPFTIVRLYRKGQSHGKDNGRKEEKLESHRRQSQHICNTPRVPAIAKSSPPGQRFLEKCWPRRARSLRPTTTPPLVDEQKHEEEDEDDVVPSDPVAILKLQHPRRSGLGGMFRCFEREAGLVDAAGVGEGEVGEGRVGVTAHIHDERFGRVDGSLGN